MNENILPAHTTQYAMHHENVDGYYHSKNDAGNRLADDKFSFFDFLDMINPLQHIPLVNIAYRAITKDSIKPISEIIGGAVFGGAAGAVGGLINTVVREETGKDIAGNILSLAKNATERNTSSNEFMRQQKRTAYDDLPVTLLAFAQTPLPVIEYSKNK